MSHVACHMSHVLCHMSYVKCLCWSLRHAEQFLFSCLCSNVAVYGWKRQWFFYSYIDSTLACEWTNHRAGSQLKVIETLLTSSCSFIYWKNKIRFFLKKHGIPLFGGTKKIIKSFFPTKLESPQTHCKCFQSRSEEETTCHSITGYSWLKMLKMA